MYFKKRKLFSKESAINFLNNLPIKKQKILLKNKSSFHLYIVLLELNKIKKITIIFSIN